MADRTLPITLPMGGARYRVGRSGSETPMAERETIPDNPGIARYAINRYRKFREHRPFARWGELSESADSTYESYVASNPDIRNRMEKEQPKCTCVRNGQYFPPGHYNWGNDLHLGGRKAVPIRQVIRPNGSPPRNWQQPRELRSICGFC